MCVSCPPRHAPTPPADVPRRAQEFSIAFEYIIVATATQIHIYRCNNLNTPHIFDVPSDTLVQLIVRSHQFVAEGVKFMHSGRLVTVFSARNYVRAAKNDAALLLIAIDGHGHLRLRAKRLLHMHED